MDAYQNSHILPTQGESIREASNWLINMADLAAIKKQIEFYFSDSNFRKDTFLRAASETDPDGFVPIATLLTFNKLKALTTDASVVANAVKDSEVVAVSEDGSKLRRVSDLPVTDSSKERTLYVKGYPIGDADVTIESVSVQFSVYGRVLMVRLRKDPATKQFKGSAFIEFEDEASMNKAHEAANQGGVVSLSYKGVPFLCVMRLNDWLQRKADKKSKPKRGADASGEPEAAAGSKRKRDGGDEEQEKVQFTEGLLIKISNVPEATTLYQIKDAFKPFGDLKYVEYENGSGHAFLRMGNKEAADAVMAKVAEGMTLTEGHANVTAYVLAGEEEVAYWTKIGTESGKRANASARGGGRGGGRGGRGRGGRGGRGGGRKRSRDE
jgi:hypothetical protein